MSRRKTWRRELCFQLLRGGRGSTAFQFSSAALNELCCQAPVKFIFHDYGKTIWMQWTKYFFASFFCERVCVHMCVCVCVCECRCVCVNVDVWRDRYVCQRERLCVNVGVWKRECMFVCKLILVLGLCVMVLIYLDHGPMTTRCMISCYGKLQTMMYY